MRRLFFLLLFPVLISNGQDYFLEDRGPFSEQIVTPEKFLGYPIGFQHTRHDRIVDYLKLLAMSSDNAKYIEYGKTYEGRTLGMLVVSSSDNLQDLDRIQKEHIKRVDPAGSASDDLPVIINLGYNVHGNEPSSSEAALLTAYIMVASQNAAVEKYRSESIIFIDPTINPDGRDRHTQWVNSFKGKNLIDDPDDIEHNEGWPRGRTNHYWFDLNRDWWLAIHPESRGKLNWYHSWYPNVVTDFHEMGTNSSYFFEPMKAIGSKDPIMPKENYTTLNDKFAEYYSKELDKIGSMYFTKEAFDGTYPGYGSSYPDLQGGLGILFEQASSRGHKQKTDGGKITFSFTIRNQLISSMATIQAAVENKQMLFDYQKKFFQSAVTKSKKAKPQVYVFGESKDQTRLKAFLDKLLIHRVEFYPLEKNVGSFAAETSYVVPVSQPQKRIVQSIFETYEEYADSVFYDASAWSLANFYNIDYRLLDYMPAKGDLYEAIPKKFLFEKQEGRNAYLIPWDDYNAPAVLNQLQENKIKTQVALKRFSVETKSGVKSFEPGTIVIPVASQAMEAVDLFGHIVDATIKYEVPMFATNTSFSVGGIDLGSRYVDYVKQPKVLMFVGNGVSSYEAGEIWHLMDQRVNLKMTKAQLRNFNSLELDKYNVMIMVSGGYSQLDSVKREKIKAWISKGNTLITQRTATEWAIKNKMVKEKLLTDEKKKDEEKTDAKTERLPYISSNENEGKKSIGGALFNVDLDLTHPVAFGYSDSNLPVYRNSNVLIKPSKNPYSNVALYSSDPHIDGFLTNENLDKLKKSVSIIVSKVGSGRVILFAENHNFRGTMYGTNKLFLNAVFFGQLINVPRVR